MLWGMHNIRPPGAGGGGGHLTRRARGAAIWRHLWEEYCVVGFVLSRQAPLQGLSHVARAWRAHGTSTTPRSGPKLDLGPTT